MTDERTIVQKAETTWDDLCSLWKRRKILCVFIVFFLCTPTLFSLSLQFRTVPKLQNEINNQKSVIITKETEINALKSERDNLSQKLNTFQALANSKFPNKNESDRLDLPISQIKSNTQNYNIKSENQTGGITAGNVQIDVNPQKPLLVQYNGMSRVKFDNGIYEKTYCYKNPEGRTLSKILLNVSFDYDFISVKGVKGTWTDGYFTLGGDKYSFDKDKRSLTFFTNILEPIACIYITVISNHDIQISNINFNEL